MAMVPVLAPLLRPKQPPGRRDAEADLIVPLEKAYLGGRERIRLEDGRSLEVNMPGGNGHWPTHSPAGSGGWWWQPITCGLR